MEIIAHFRKIDAKETVFIQMKNRYLDEYNNFINYILKIEENEQVRKNSGKASSYARYLIRLIIFYNQNYKDNLDDLRTFSAVKKIERLRSDFKEEFKIYNLKESRFPNATLNCYISYVAYLNSENERVVDDKLNKELNTLHLHQDKVEESSSRLQTLEKRKSKIVVESKLVYPRNPVVSIQAKLKSNWKCEFNEYHETFISNANKKPYVDAHHLIPMATQDYFDNTIDFTDNVVCLCPTCHSRIHYAIMKEKNEMIDVLYDKRKASYERYEVDIDKQKLLNFYSIF